jgi:hypothetical protein
MTNETMKSRACKIGNRLAGTMGRSAAFREAWTIVRGSVEIAVKGVSFGSRQEAIRRLGNYRPADIRVFIAPEPGNPVDRNAAAVMVGVQGGRGYYRLGYVPAELAPAAPVVRAAAIRLVDGTTRGARITLTA